MAKGRVLSTVISLGGKVDGSLLKALNKSQGQTNKAAKAMNKSLSDNSRAAGKVMSGAFKQAATGVFKVFAVVKSLSALKSYASETLTAAKAQIEVETKLASVLENVKSLQIRGPNAAQEAAKKLSGVADQYEKIGVVGDEVIKSGMQQLATYQLSDKEIIKLTGGMSDLLAQQKGLNATQSDGVAIGNLIGKAMSGNVGALSRVGITFTEAEAKAIKTGDATQRAATIAQVLKNNVGGVNKALGQTDQGKMLQVGNTFDEIKENIGYFLLPLLAQLARNILPYAQTALTKVVKVLDKASPVISNLIDNGFKKIAEIMPFVSTVFKEIAPIIGNFMMPLGNLKTLMPIIVSTFKELWPSILQLAKSIMPLISQLRGSLIPAFQSLLPPIITMVKSLVPVLISLLSEMVPPIISVVSEIAPLIALLIASLLPAIQMLIPPIVNIIKMIFPTIISLVTTILGVFKALAPIIAIVAQIFAVVLIGALNAIMPVINGIMTLINDLLNVFTEIINFIVNVFTLNWTGAWQNIQNIFAGIFHGIVNFAKMPLNMIIGMVNDAISGINGLTSIINKIPGVNIGEIPQIPFLAKGATVTSPTLAMIGEGRDAETVVPHNNSPRSRMLLAEAARGVGAGINNRKLSFMPAVDRIAQSLSYFGDHFSQKNRQASDATQTVNNSTASKSVSFTYAPVINAKDAKGVKEVLDEDFERFKAWYLQMQDEVEREVFAQ